MVSRNRWAMYFRLKYKSLVYNKSDIKKSHKRSIIQCEILGHLIDYLKKNAAELLIMIYLGLCYLPQHLQSRS